jgi:hypothetical protein
MREGIGKRVVRCSSIRRVDSNLFKMVQGELASQQHASEET